MWRALISLRIEAVRAAVVGVAIPNPEMVAQCNPRPLATFDNYDCQILPAIGKDAAMTTRESILKPAVWGFYILVVLEFLFMISPAALHFYAGYGPILNFLHGSPWTSWLTSFYLPHISETGSFLLDSIRPFGLLLIAGGLVLFLVGVVQIYGAKLLGRGAVTGGLYRLVRHPQYSALAVVGMGTVLIWPRFLVLLSFVTMLFLYLWLAISEERRCLEKYGDSYREYQSRTGMLLPRPFNRWLHEPNPERTMSLTVVLGVYAGALVVVAALGFAAQALSLSMVSSSFGEDFAVLSPARLTEKEIADAFQVAQTDEELQKRLASQTHQKKLLVYVVPANWFLPDLPLHTEEEIRRVGGGHGTPDFDRRSFQVLFTRPRLHHQEVLGAEIVRRAYGRDPILIVDVDLGTNKVVGHRDAPDSVVWGDIPTPMF